MKKYWNRMKNKNDSLRAKISVCMIAILYVGIVVLCFVKPDFEFSNSERRRLEQKPLFSWEALENGQYTQKLEAYVSDQFPFREQLRTWKALFSSRIMQKQDVNGIYQKDGYLCKIEYPADHASFERAADIFTKIYMNLIAESEASVYVSIIPDKNYFLADACGVPSLEYAALMKEFYQKMDFAKAIDITKSLELMDYYKTDIHWKQEALADTAALLAKEMEVPFQGDFSVHTVEAPFYGVYCGQAGLPVTPDEMRYLTSPLLDICEVYDYENNQQISLYDLNKTFGKDPYEMFLGGNISLAVIENEQALSERELVVFGDSFSRSLLPLLGGSYQKITLVDIRYLPSAYVGKYLTFTNQDVIFLYSIPVLNNSITLK